MTHSQQDDLDAVTMIGANLRSIISESNAPADKSKGFPPTEGSPVATKSRTNAES